ncbi:MAG TPA: HipA family kinase [Acidobacteriaceae bacterium]|nr:HipA family kinase [Acidobacteriaceae bacterium]
MNRYTIFSMLRTVQATRYVLPLREGGSLPAIVEADDLGLYVVKFRGAGQGVLALIAEVIAGEIGRALGLCVPELVLAELDPALGRNEPDCEIRQLLKASPGTNLGLDYLPGATMFDPAARDKAPEDEASLLVWFDAFTQNVDRTPRNANLLVWHRKLYPIDHGAALYWHHNWPAREEKIASPFPEIAHHVLLPWATQISQAGAVAREWLTPDALAAIVEMVPETWLDAVPDGLPAAERRAGYVEFLMRRLASANIFEEEAARARLV